MSLQRWLVFFQNEKGSGGIELIILGALVGWLLLFPLGCFFIERHMYAIETIRSVQVVNEAIESIQLQVRTDALSQGQVQMRNEFLEHLFEEDLEAHFSQVKGRHQVKKMVFKWENDACRLELTLGIEPVTALGQWLTDADGLLSINIQSVVELPLNQ